MAAADTACEAGKSFAMIRTEPELIPQPAKAEDDPTIATAAVSAIFDNMFINLLLKKYLLYQNTATRRP
jgi:hypothetical protein